MQRPVDLKQVFSWFEKCIKVCIVYRKILWSTWLSGQSFVSYAESKPAMDWCPIRRTAVNDSHPLSNTETGEKHQLHVSNGTEMVLT